MALHGPDRAGILTELAGPALAAASLALAHFVAPALSRIESRSRNGSLSVAGGMAVAYVFVHLLPELAAGQAELRRALGEVSPAHATTRGGILDALAGEHVYVLALAGLVAFYGLERLALSRVSGATHSSGADVSSDEGQLPGGVFWIHLLAFAVYNMLIGYLLLHRPGEGGGSLAMFTVAMALHFLVAGAALNRHYRRRYHERGRWVLAAAVLLGALMGAVVNVGQRFLILGIAFLAGGIILNVLKEEMPSDRGGRFWAFAAGATMYALVAVLA